ncbi:hypothetical protein GCM10025331_21960 [Actinoplanes utahensis]|nr:hypothetical protein Aut01nite_35430 [Actinoplanes utahensis]
MVVDPMTDGGRGEPRNAEHMPSKKPGDARWAPWWVYVIVIVGGNYVKQHFVQDRPVAINAAITLALAGSLFLLITAVYRRT